MTPIGFVRGRAVIQRFAEKRNSLAFSRRRDFITASRLELGHMPIRHKAAEAGILQPTELALLRRVFDLLKTDDQSLNARDALASRIIANYMAGIRDEAELASLSKQPLGR